RKLVVSDQLVLNGFHCPSCKSLYDEFKMGCTVCGGGLLEVDLGYALMSRTKELDGEIEVVHNNKSLNDRGAVGAFLRNLNR
ncbi:MAG TPA: hypothetical protein VJL87_07725, partial [Bdellovibrionota bacterium]|nr:hypothetical protein [Bdellovibrionota bacterium]